MKTSGTTIYFNCKPPTKRDLTLLPRVTVTSLRVWIPQKVYFPKTSLPDDGQELQVQKLDLTRDDEYESMLDNEFEPGLFSGASSSDDQHQVNQPMANDIPERNSFVSKEHTNILTAEDVSNRWLIGLNQATTTLSAKTQFVTRSPTMPLARRYRADIMFHQQSLNQIFYTDTVYFNCKSINGNVCAQIFSN